MKRAFCLLLVAAVLCTTLSVPAFAANASGQDVPISYTVETTYTVYIPETIDLNSTPFIEIEADSMLEPSRHLYVRIDESSVFDTGVLLYKDGNEDASVLGCTILVGASGESEAFYLRDTDYTVAVFESGNRKAIEYGNIYLSLNIAGNQEFGTYYGTICFTFSVE